MTTWIYRQNDYTYYAVSGDQPGASYQFGVGVTPTGAADTMAPTPLQVGGRLMDEDGVARWGATGEGAGSDDVITYVGTYNRGSATVEESDQQYEIL